MLSDSDKLYNIMDHLGLRPAQLASGLGRAPSEISFVLSGARKLSAGIMLDLHERYRVALPYLRRGEGKMIDNQDGLLTDRENTIIDWSRRDLRNQEILYKMVVGFLEYDRKTQKVRKQRKKKKKEKTTRR